jgi:hypothetical protein
MRTETDTEAVIAIATMIRARIRRLEAQLLELRGLTSRLLETVDASETEQETDSHEQHRRNGTGTPIGLG